MKLRRLLVLVVPLVLFAVWVVAARLGWPSPRAVPPPGAVAAAAFEALVAGALWRDLGATLLRTCCGVAIATALGAALGAALGLKPPLWRAVEPSVDFLRAIPPLLVFPVLLLGLGYGDSARVAAVVFGTTGTVLIHVAQGLEHVPQERVDIVRLSGKGALGALRVLYFWQALPSLVTGVRTALAQGLVIATVTEMIVGARSGLGARALEAQLAYRADLLWVVILLAGAAGFLLSGAAVAIERRLVDWG